MIDKELCVGDRIMLNFDRLHDALPVLADELKEAKLDSGKIHFVIEEICDDNTMLLHTVHCKVHKDIWLSSVLVLERYEYVGHIWNAVVKNDCGEAVSRRATIPKDEAEDVERVNVLDAMAESKTEALQEYEPEQQSIDDNMKAAEEAEANLKATEVKLVAKEAVNVQKSVSSDYIDVIAGMVMKDDKISHPSHYPWLKELCGIEVIDIARHLDFDMGNALKYLLRAGKKNEEGYTNTEKEIEDLKKAVWYLNDKIKMLEEEDERE